MNSKKKPSQTPSKTPSLSVCDPNIKEAASVTFSIQDSALLQKLNTALLTNYIKGIIIGTPLAVDDVTAVPLYGKPSTFKAIDIKGVEDDALSVEIVDEKGESGPKKFLITKNTLLNIVDINNANKAVNETESGITGMKTFSKDDEKNNIVVAGLDKQIAEFIKIIKNLNTEIPHQGLLKEFLSVKGVLIYGPSGVGKTLLVKHVSTLFNDIRFFFVNTRELLSKYVGESEKKISEIFQQARKNKPCVLFFDDVHILFNKKEVGGANSMLIINTFLQEIDNIITSDKILVVIATSQITSLDNSLRRAGRFDKEIKIEVPDLAGRYEILKTYVEKIPNEITSEDIKEISENINGFTGADITALLRESLLKTLGTNSSEETDNELIEKVNDLKLTKRAIEDSVEEINPSGIKDLLLEIPKVLWSDIGGYAHVKDEIKQVIEWPLKHPESYVRMTIKPSRGILLYGPPGCSKTMIAKAIATESKLNFIAVKGPEIFSKYVGDSEKAIRDLFKRARLCAPAIIFFDEIDAIATQRSADTEVSDRVLTQLLTEMDGVDSLKHVIVVAATNRPDSIDMALLRPGRFDHLIYIDLPDKDCRREILNLNIVKNNMPREEDININELATLTEGYTGAETCMIVREAGMNALARDLQNAKVEKDDFLYALKKIKPRIGKDTISYYESFQNNSKLA